MTILIFNSKDKEQKKLVNATLNALDNVKGKEGWWARVVYDDGDNDICYYHDGSWGN